MTPNATLRRAEHSSSFRNGNFSLVACMTSICSASHHDDEHCSTEARNHHHLLVSRVMVLHIYCVVSPCCVDVMKITTSMACHKPEVPSLWIRAPTESREIIFSGFSLICFLYIQYTVQYIYTVVLQYCSVVVVDISEFIMA